MVMSINLRNLVVGKMGFVKMGLGVSKELLIKFCVVVLGVLFLSGCSIMEDLIGVDLFELFDILLLKFENLFKKLELKLFGECILVMSVKCGGVLEFDVGVVIVIIVFFVIIVNSEWI